ncbi:hypothetical protein CBR_g8715 [Chara braunii]|uniref:Uncharacterized protein n=1 Tax=Chara braunii TaxID=69332 RepID=A0A388KMK9_CHABU|nr:hypothetical protein CBR_g8715 [Chara braunii]|eukprot:GBG71294.1 hypothetical protein CBR_g8715 [Chara braunii]
MGAVRESSGGEQTPSKKKSERQRMVREEVAEGTLRMKRMRGKPEALMGGDGGGDGERASGKKPANEEGGTASKKARRPGGLTIREGQAAGGGDSADPGAAAAREPSGKSKRKVAAEEGDGQKKPRRRKTAEAASGGEGPVGQECDEAAAFRLEYERNDVGEIVEKELPVQLLIDPRKVCDIPPWERYYNHHSLSRETVDDIKDAMLSHFREKKIWTKNPLVLAPIYKPVSRRLEQADRVHKDVFKPEDKDKYYYYPVNGQHTVAAVKELEGEQIFDLWKMHSWPARVVWFSDRDFAGYRQWMPLVTASDDVFRKAMKFYAKWAEGKLLGGDGKTPLSRPGKYMPDKSLGLQAIPEMGSKGVAGETKMGWLVRVPPPPTKKKTQADDKFFVVVKEPDMFCGQCLADMTDVEKLSTLDDILALRGVFVQSAGGHLKRQHKPGIKDMVAATKVDRMMLRMFHYILFLEMEADERVWRYESFFFRTEGRLLEEFGPQGLTKQCVNTCKRTLPHEKESLDDAKKLYEDDRFPKSFEKSVRSILRRTEEEVRDTAIREVVRHYVWNLYVLDLCDPTLLTDWREDDFANLQGLLQTLSPTHWTLVIFFPSRWELSFLKGMTRLSVHHVRTGKWVCNAQKQATVREGNMLVEECDRLYVIFNGEKLEDNTFAVYPASSPTKASRAHGPSPAKHTVADRSKAVCSSDPSGQAVACFDVAEEERFIRSMWEDGDVTSSQGPAYREMERNPSRLVGLLENFCKAGQTVFFFGKAHASVVWELLRTGRNVVVLEKEAKMIDYLHDLHEFVKARVADTRNACEFRNLVFAVLNGYHGAPRDFVSHFLRRLEHVYFTLAEPLTLENYKSQFDEDDPFDAEDMEKLSDSETFDFESMPLPRVVGQHPGGGGGGDEGDGGGGVEDGSQFAGKGTGETSSVEKASGGKGSGGKGSGGKGSGGKGSGGKGSGGKGWDGKGSGGKGSGGKRRTSGNPEYMKTDPHCVGSRDSDMRDEDTLTSDQVRVDSHLSARSLFPVAQESPSRRAQQRSPVLNTLLLKEGASSFSLEGGMPSLRRSEGATSGSLGSGDRHKLRIHSDLLPSPYAISAPHATVSRGQENVTSWPPHLQLDTGLPYSPPFSCVETRDWRFRDVLEGPAPGVLETGGSENERHTPGEDECSPGTRAVHREEETQRWQSRKVLETGGSECERHASEALVIGTSEEVLHSRSAVATTREGVVKGGKWTSVQAPVLGDEESAVEARVHSDEKGGEVTVDIRTDPQRKDGDSSPTRCGEEQGGRASVLNTARGMVLHEAIELGNDSAATELASDSGVAEMQNIESSVEGGEVAVSINMDPERKDHDSPSTRCGAEQGDRASVLSTGREMVLHEPIDLPSDSVATELVSDTAVAEVQKLESFVDVGAVARQEGEFPQRAPEHGNICE